MKIELLPEPELQFGHLGRHVDIRFGIRNYGPLAIQDRLAPSKIRVALIGTPETIQGVKDWIALCAGGVVAKVSQKPNLFPEFPGFRKDGPFGCECVITEKLERPISPRALNELLTGHTHNAAVTKAVDFFFTECRYLEDKAPVDVFVCAPPSELMSFLDSGANRIDEEERVDIDDEDGSVEEESHAAALDFHDLLKSRALGLRRPVQMIRPSTYDDTAAKAVISGETRHVQDEATRAWNFHTALYYKAGGIPWRLLRSLDSETCFIGVSFFRSLDQASIQTSVAQIFNERGEGVVLRGGEAEPNTRDPKLDRVPHLSEENMRALVDSVLQAYLLEHKHSPPRVVIHKTSAFSMAELKGAHRALDGRSISARDFLSVSRSFTRLFRVGQYPPLRGTYLELDKKTHLLYTRGSTDFYQVYPGLYVPRPIEFRCEDTQTTPRKLAEEILALTKMNWNNTQFDSRDPITIRAARQVGNIVRYVDKNAALPTSYSYYM